jgi:hypothetical protein
MQFRLARVRRSGAIRVGRYKPSGDSASSASLNPSVADASTMPPVLFELMNHSTSSSASSAQTKQSSRSGVQLPAMPRGACASSQAREQGWSDCSRPRRQECGPTGPRRGLRRRSRRRIVGMGARLGVWGDVVLFLVVVVIVAVIAAFAFRDSRLVDLITWAPRAPGSRAIRGQRHPDGWGHQRRLSSLLR